MKKTELTISNELSKISKTVDLEFNGEILTPNYDNFVIPEARYISPKKEKFLGNQYIIFSLLERNMFEDNYKFVKYLSMSIAFFTANDSNGNLYYYSNNTWNLFEHTHIAPEFVEEFDAKLMIIAR